MKEFPMHLNDGLLAMLPPKLLSSFFYLFPSPHCMATGEKEDQAITSAEERDLVGLPERGLRVFVLTGLCSLVFFVPSYPIVVYCLISTGGLPLLTGPEEVAHQNVN